MLKKMKSVFSTYQMNMLQSGKAILHNMLHHPSLSMKKDTADFLMFSFHFYIVFVFKVLHFICYYVTICETYPSYLCLLW